MSNTSTSDQLLSVLDEPASSPAIHELLDTISKVPIKLTVKDFKSVSYRSAQEHGLSLQYEGGICKAVDLYNEGAVKGWSSFTKLPIDIDLKDDDNKKLHLHLDKDTTGVDIVKQMGEPDRTGGGEPMKGGGASGLGPGAWMEWKKLHKGEKIIDLMIEMAGQDARGRDRWEKERAGSSIWGVCTLAVV